jgi:hypothetical protein
MSRIQLGRQLTLPTPAVGIALAVLLVGIILAWTTAYRMGYSRADERATRELSLAAAPVQDPLRADPAAGGGPAALPPPQVRSQAQAQPVAAEPRQARPQAAPAAGAARAVMCPPEPDPRQPGLNYFAIEGQLDREGAITIVTFLAENGVDSLAFDTDRGAGNNPRSWRVYGLRGFSVEEYRSPARVEYEQRISRLGEIFRRDHRGWTDFSRTNWARYQPQ